MCVQTMEGPIFDDDFDDVVGETKTLTSLEVKNIVQPMIDNEIKAVLKDKHARLTAHYNTMERAKQASLECLEGKVQGRLEALEEKESTLASLETKMSEMNTHTSLLREEGELLDTQLIDVRREIASMTAESKEKHSEIEQLRGECALHTNKQEELEQVLNTTQANYSVAKREFDALEGNLKKVKEDLRRKTIWRDDVMKEASRTQKKTKYLQVYFIAALCITVLLLFSSYRFVLLASVLGMDDVALAGIINSCSSPHASVVAQRLQLAERTSAQFTQELSTYQATLQNTREKLRELEEAGVREEQEASTTAPTQNHSGDGSEGVVHAMEEVRYFQLREKECDARYSELLKEKHTVQTELSFLTDNLIGYLRSAIKLSENGGSVMLGSEGLLRFDWAELLLVVVVTAATGVVSFVIGARLTSHAVTVASAAEDKRLSLSHADSFRQGPSFSSSALTYDGGEEKKSSPQKLTWNLTTPNGKMVVLAGGKESPSPLPRRQEFLRSGARTTSSMPSPSSLPSSTPSFHKSISTPNYNGR